LTVPRLPSAVHSILRHRLAKPVLFLIYLLPLAGLIRGVWLDTLGANPAEFLIRATGDWTLRALCLVLCVSPLRVVLGWPVLARFRRMMGVFSFFYASVHLAATLGLTWAGMWLISWRILPNGPLFWWVLPLG